MKKYQEILDEARSRGITRIEDVMEEAIKIKIEKLITQFSME